MSKVVNPDESSEQLSRFKETARKLGCDEDEGAFKKKLGVIARQKPKQQVSPTSELEPEKRARRTRDN